MRICLKLYLKNQIKINQNVLLWIIKEKKISVK